MTNEDVDATTSIVREMHEHARHLARGATPNVVDDHIAPHRKGLPLSRSIAPLLRVSAGVVGLLLVATLVVLQTTGGPTAGRSTARTDSHTVPGADDARRLASGGSAVADSGKAVPIVGTSGETSDLSVEGTVSTASFEAAKNAPTRTGRFDLPLKQWFMVTDRYGAPRGRGTVHGGIDLALDGLPNSPVLVACEGTVVTSAFNAVLGNHVIIDCGEEWTTVYGHLSSMRVAAGDTMTFERVIGFSGSTGFSSGEHLHFEIRWRGWAVNPEKYLDFHIALGAPLTYDNRDANGDLITGPVPTPTPTPTATPTPDFSIIPPHLRPTAIPTRTPIPTATRIPPIPTITPTPTATPFSSLDKQ